MDNLTHTLVGVLLGRAGLKRSTGRATAALVIASNLPDSDSFVARLFGAEPIAVHRGFTHGVGGWLTLPFVTLALILLWDRFRPSKEPVRPWAVLLVAAIATLAHSLLDLFTTYGTRIFEPLSHQWFYTGTWFIVDPWVWIALILGLEFSWRAERLGGNWNKPAIAAFAALFVYAAFNVGITQRVEAAARHHLAAARPTLVAAGPQPILFWRRSILWRNSKVHGFGSFDLVGGLQIDRTSQPNRLDDPRLARAMRTSPHVRAFMFWSRMPVVVERNGRAFLSDQRFSRGPMSRGGGPFLIPLG